MTYRKRPEKYSVIWDRKMRRKIKRIEKAFTRSMECSWWWHLRCRHWDIETEEGARAFWNELYRQQRSQRRITKKYYSNRGKSK